MKSLEEILTVLRPIWQARAPRRMLIAGLIISCAIHAFVIIRQPVAVGLTSRDSGQYWTIASNVAQGRGYTFDDDAPTRMRQPLYPLFIAGLHMLFGSSVLPVQIAQEAACLCTIIIWGVLATEVLGPTAGGLSALFIGLYYPLPILAARVVSEPLYILLFSAAVLCWLVSLRRWRYSWALACGALLGLTSLCRPAALAYLPVLPLAMWAQSRWRSRGLGLGLAALLAFGLVLLPWGIRNYLVFDEFTVASRDDAAALWVGVHPMTVTHWYDYMKAIERTEEYRRLRGTDSYLGPATAKRFKAAALQRIRSDPYGVVKRGAIKVFLTWTYLPGTRPWAVRSPWLFRLMRLPQLLVLLVAVVGAVRTPTCLWSTALIIFLLTSAGCFLGPATGRYVVPAMPFVLLLAANALRERNVREDEAT